MLMSCRLQRLHNKSEANELEPCAWRCKTVRAQAPCARNGQLPSLCVLLHPGPAQALQTVLPFVQRGSPPTMLCCFPYSSWSLSCWQPWMTFYLASKYSSKCYIYFTTLLSMSLMCPDSLISSLTLHDSFNSLHREIIIVFYLLEFNSLILRSYNRVVSKLRSNALVRN